MINSGRCTGCRSGAARCLHGYISLVSGKLRFYVPDMERGKECVKYHKGSLFIRDVEDDDQIQCSSRMPELSAGGFSLILINI